MYLIKWEADNRFVVVILAPVHDWKNASPAIPMTWCLGWFKTSVVGVGVLFLPTIFLARKLRNGEENEQALREREKEKKKKKKNKKKKKKRLLGVIVNF